MFKFSNNSKSLLAAAISNTDLVFSVTGGEGALFPAAGNYRITLIKATGAREIVEVESRSTDALTIVSGGRGLEGTTALTYSAGDVTSGVVVRLAVTQGVLERFLQRLASTYQAVLDCTGLTADRTVVVPNKAGTIAMLDDVAVLWTTGDAKLTLKTSADTGWVMANDGTLGNTSSGGTTRANADTEALFTLLWNNISNTYAAVSTGRGASAAADFAANKTIALPKVLGRALAVAGSGASLTVRALGETLGAETHALTTNEMPAHTHDVANVLIFAGGSYNAFSNTANPGTATTTSTGGGAAHNNMQPSTFINVMIKL
jgi:hypothetical protein